MVEERFGAAAHVGRFAGALQNAPAKVGQGDVDAGRADIDADDVAEAGVDVEQPGATAAGGLALARFGQDFGVDHAADDAGDAGAGVVEVLRQIGAGERPAAADGGDDGRFKWFQH